MPSYRELATVSWTPYVDPVIQVQGCSRSCRTVVHNKEVTTGSCTYQTGGSSDDRVALEGVSADNAG